MSKPGDIVREVDGKRFALVKPVEPAFASLSFAGYNYAYHDRVLFRVESARNGIISGKKVKRDGTTSDTPYSVDSAGYKVEVWVVSKTEESD